MERNDIDHDDLISILFTATDDIHSMFPALAARTIGLGDVPLICARELDIDGAMPLCIRMLMHMTTDAVARRAAPRLPRGRRRPPRRPPELSRLMAEPQAAPAPQRRSARGLIGGSIGLALRAQGWHVTGRDRNGDMAARAIELGALDAIGEDPDAEITVRGHAGRRHRRARSSEALAWTSRARHRRRQREDADASTLMADPRYVGGHPMAGSELEGVDGARPDLFEGATWVLTPMPGTDDDGATPPSARSCRRFGADGHRSIPPDRHDALVAVVSHVPHLTAATLMGLAAERSEEHRAAAAPGRRRLPRHDPHRRRPSGHLARHLRREPRWRSSTSSTG